jgi:hypothetical protein
LRDGDRDRGKVSWSPEEELDGSDLSIVINRCLRAADRILMLHATSSEVEANREKKDHQLCFPTNGSVKILIA